MAKRIYEYNVLKWGAGLGITSGTFIGILFMYLSFLGAIEITGYSGDMRCAGNNDDPCYAYINLTANEDIFIYPIGYDPYGRGTIINFKPGIKSWKFQRSWGNGWRDIPLNETCTGTWCGAPNNLGVKYSYVLRKNKDYNFRVVGYKNEINDLIKWSVNYNDREYLDPAWLPANNLFDSTIFNEVSNICSGTRYGMEVDVYPCKVQDVDGKNIVQFVDFKYSGVNPLNVSWVFMYSGNLSSGRMELLSNVTENYTLNEKENDWGQIIIYDIISYEDLGTPNSSCQIGNENNTKMFKVVENQQNSTTKIYCFTNVTVINSTTFQISGNYDKDITVDSERQIQKWVDITELIEYIGYNLNNGSQSYYVVRDSLFNQGTEYKTKWTYTPKDSERNGKWSIFGYQTETGLINAINTDAYIFLDPWWDNSWGKKRNISNLTGEYPTINISYDSDMNIDFSDLRFLDSTETTELNYTIRTKINSSWAYVTIDSNNESSIYMYYSNNGASSTSNGNDTFLLPLRYYGLDDDLATTNVIDLTNNGNGTATTNTNNLVDTSDGYLLNSFDFNSQTETVDALPHDALTSALTVSAWVKVEDLSGVKGIVVSFDGSQQHIIFWVNNNELGFYTSISGSNQVGGNTQPFTVTNQWVHVVARYNGSLMQTYYEGVTNGTTYAQTGDIYSGGTSSYEFATYLTQFHDIKLDEVTIWNKALTSHQISEINSMSDQSDSYILGSEEINTTKPIINLNYPSNDYSSTNQTLNFNCTGSDGLNLTKIELYIDNVLNQTNSSVINNTLTNFYVTSISRGDHNWTCKATNNESVSTTADSRNFTIEYNYLSGTLKDSDGNAINNGKIFVLNQSDNSLVGVNTSNGTGYWTLGPILPGTYIVTGYDPANSSLNGDAEPHIVVP